MAYEEYDYYNEPSTGSLKESLREILNGLRNEKNLREAGISLKEALQLTPNVTESLGRGGVAQAIGTSGDLRDLSNTINSYLPKSVRNFTRAAEFLANPYATAIQQTAPTTESTLEFVPRVTDPYQGYKQHETLGEFVAPSLGYFGGKAAKAYGNYVGPTAYKAVEDYLVKSGGILPMETWHGSKSSFDEFDPKKVGSSSGIDYGHGLYSAEHPEIAKGFGQNLYKLDIPDEHIPKMIDWYSTEQTPEVTKILKEAGLPYKATGEEITMAAAEKMGGSDEAKSGFQKAAEYLHSLGIKGNKYENFQIKKGQGADTYNYVSYDPTEVKILEKNGQKLASDIDELGFHSPLENAILKIGQPKGTGDQFLKQLEKMPGVKIEELEVTGVKRFLEDHPTVTKQELQDYIQHNRVKLENKVLGAATEDTYGDYQLRGGDVYHDDDYIANIADDLHYDMKNDEIIRDQERQALLEADPERYADHETNPYSQARLEEDIDGSLYEQAKAQANDMYYENPIRHYYDDHGYDIYGNDDMGYSVKDPNGRFLDIGGRNGLYDLGDAEAALRNHLLDEGVIDIDGGGAKHEDWTLPGKYENYREILTTHDPKPMPPIIKDLKNGYWIAQDDPKLETGSFGKTRQEAIDNYRANRPTSYESGHYGDTPNVLAHMRVNDRIIDGKKTLFVEEIQSDLHQAGRKKGYQGGRTVHEIDKDLDAVVNELRSKPNVQYAPTEKDWARYPELTARHDALYAERASAPRKDAVPNFPFKKNWHELMVKQALDMAVKEGYDAVAFTTGRQQVERYENSLRKAVDEINFNKRDDNTVSIAGYKGNRETFAGVAKDGKFISGPQEAIGKTIEEVVGKGIAKQINEGEALKPGVIRGKDLTIGGEQMKTFYDEMIPYFVNKYSKKYGMAMKKANLEQRMSVDDFREYLKTLNMTQNEFDALPQDKRIEIVKKGGDEVHFVELTDAAKKDIKSKGQPLFSGIGLAAPALMPEDQDKTKK